MRRGGDSGNAASARCAGAWPRVCSVRALVSPRFQVSPYMRGYAPTDAGPAGPMPQDATARDVLALIEALGARSAVLVGHDFGAIAAYGAASIAPHRVRLLIALSIPHPATLRATVTATARKVARGGAALLL
jgi:pimeloyl-ACP methyl ester carboxylesterase